MGLLVSNGGLLHAMGVERHPCHGSSAVRIALQRHQGDDDVFFVIQMTQQGRGCRVESVGHAGGVVCGVGCGRADGLMQRIAVGGEGFEVGVDSVVVAVQQVDADGNARLEPTEMREILRRLDVVVAVEVLEEISQCRQQAVVKGAQIDSVGAIGCGDLIHMGAGLTKAVMHLKPEGRRLGQGGGVPAVARKAVTQPDEFSRQGGAVRQRPQSLA